jgi:hypothetical protein
MPLGLFAQPGFNTKKIKIRAHFFGPSPKKPDLAQKNRAFRSNSSGPL